MEEIGNVTHLEIKVNGVNKRTVRVDMQPVDSGVGQFRPGRLRHRGRRHGRAPLTAPPCSGEHVLLGGGRRWKADKPHGGHDWFELVVCHNGFEGTSVPERQLPRTTSHVVLHWCNVCVCVCDEIIYLFKGFLFFGDEISEEKKGQKWKRKDESKKVGIGNDVSDWSVRFWRGFWGRDFERGLVGWHPSWRKLREWAGLWRGARSFCYGGRYVWWF